MTFKVNVANSTKPVKKVVNKFSSLIFTVYITQ